MLVMPSTGPGMSLSPTWWDMEIVVARFGRVLFERVEVVLVALEIVLLVIAQRLAVRAGLVCATMSVEAVSR
jgi:hypothetical protein